MKQEPLNVNVRIAAFMVGVSVRKMHALTKSGEVPHIRIGRRVLYPVKELRQWLSGKVQKKHHEED